MENNIEIVYSYNGRDISTRLYYMNIDNMDINELSFSHIVCNAIAQNLYDLSTHGIVKHFGNKEHVKVSNIRLYIIGIPNKPISNKDELYVVIDKELDND